MDLKEYYREEIRRRKLEGDQGDGVSLAQLEAEFAKLLESERSSSDTEHNSSSEHRAGNIAPKLTLDSTQPEEDIPEFVREEQPYYAIDGYPYDDFFGAIEGGMRGASRHGKIGVDRSGKVYARDGISELDKRLVELKWEYAQTPERRDEIAAEAARLRAQHEGEYTVTEEMPLSQFQLLESDFLKELQSGPPALEPPPVPEEEIAAALDEEFSDGPEFHNTYGPEFRNAPEWVKIHSETEDPVIIEGRTEGERILAEIRGQYIGIENPSAFDKLGTTTFERNAPRQEAVKELQEKQNGPEFLQFLDSLLSFVPALKGGIKDPSTFTNNLHLNQIGTTTQTLLEDTIENNGKPGIITTLYQTLHPYAKPNDVPKARDKLALFHEKRHYQNLVNASSKTEFIDLLTKKIGEIERNMPQKYDDPEQDRKYREAVLEPLKYALLVNEHSDEIFDQLYRDFERIDNAY